MKAAKVKAIKHINVQPAIKLFATLEIQQDNELGCSVYEYITARPQTLITTYRYNKTTEHTDMPRNMFVKV